MTFDSRSVQSGHWKANILTRQGSLFLESIAISSGYQASPIVMLCRFFLFQVSRAPAQGVGKVAFGPKTRSWLDVVCIIGVAYVSRHVSPQLGPAFKRKKQRGIGRFLAFALDHWRFYGLNDVGAYCGDSWGNHVSSSLLISRS